MQSTNGYDCHMHTYVRMNVCMYVCMYVRMCVCLHVRTYVRTYLCMCHVVGMLLIYSAYTYDKNVVTVLWVTAVCIFIAC